MEPEKCAEKKMSYLGKSIRGFEIKLPDVVLHWDMNR